MRIERVKTIAKAAIKEFKDQLFVLLIGYDEQGKEMTMCRSISEKSVLEDQITLSSEARLAFSCNQINEYHVLLSAPLEETNDVILCHAAVTQSEKCGTVYNISEGVLTPLKGSILAPEGMAVFLRLLPNKKINFPAELESSIREHTKAYEFSGAKLQPEEQEIDYSNFYDV